MTRIAEPVRGLTMGMRVRKTKGSSWQGRVVGHYSTRLTPRGVCVESEREPGSVQIYPEAALVHIEEAADGLEVHERLRIARFQAGFKRAVAAARCLDIPIGTYGGHEAGTRGLGLAEVELYASAFGVKPAWLAFGDAASPLALQDKTP